jgi:hypothetical protein
MCPSNLRFSRRLILGFGTASVIAANAYPCIRTEATPQHKVTFKIFGPFRLGQWIELPDKENKFVDADTFLFTKSYDGISILIVYGFKGEPDPERTILVTVSLFDDDNELMTTVKNPASDARIQPPNKRRKPGRPAPVGVKLNTPAIPLKIDSLNGVSRLRLEFEDLR